MAFHRPGWVPVEDQRLRKMFNEGSSDEAISRVMARSVLGVKRRRQILGLHRGSVPGKAKDNETRV